MGSLVNSTKCLRKTLYQFSTVSSRRYKQSECFLTYSMKQNYPKSKSRQKYYKKRKPQTNMSHAHRCSSLSVFASCKGCKMTHPLWKTGWQFLKIPKIELWSSTPTLGICYIKKIKNRISKRYLHIHVHSSIIHNSQEVEAAQVSINRWMDKQNVIHAHTNIIQPWKERKYYHMLHHGWNLRILF